MQIVKTIGQAFEVCHRISAQSEQSEEAAEADGSKSLAEIEPTATNSKWFNIPWILSFLGLLIFRRMIYRILLHCLLYTALLCLLLQVDRAN